MVDEIGIVKGIRNSKCGNWKKNAHVTAVAGRALSRQGRKDRGERYDNVPNVEMWELEKEMDKDGRVVFGLGWATR